MKKTMVVFIDVFTLFNKELDNIEINDNFKTLLEEFNYLKKINECNNFILSLIVSRKIDENNISILLNFLFYINELTNNISDIKFGKFLYKGEIYELKDGNLKRELGYSLNITENILNYIKELSKNNDVKGIYLLDENASTSIYYNSFNSTNIRKLKESNNDIPLIVFVPSVYNLRSYDNKYYGDKYDTFISLSNKSGISGILDCINCYIDNIGNKTKVLKKKYYMQ